MIWTFFSTSMGSSEDGAVVTSSLCSLTCSVLVAFAPLGLVGPLFFGAIAPAASGGVQHCCVGVRGTILLLEKAALQSSSSALQFSVVSGCFLSTVMLFSTHLGPAGSTALAVLLVPRVVIGVFAGFDIAAPW